MSAVLDAERDLLPMLQLSQVHAFSATEKDIRLRGFSGSLAEGELVHLQMDRQRDPRALVSLFLGLQLPESGEIKYRGEDWLGSDFDRHFSMRSQIGRVYSTRGWVQNLSVGENVRISQLNQGQPLSKVEHAIEVWIPRLAGSYAATVERALNRRPALVADTVLQVCQLIRAFAIEPRMLLLESPTSFLPSELKGLFIEALADACARGGAAIWIDVDPLPTSLEQTLRVQRWSIVNDALQVSAK